MTDRSKEEIRDILATWPDAFEKSFGKKMDETVMRTVINNILQQKEIDLIRQRFFDFTPQNLRQIIEMLEKPVMNSEKAIKKSKK